MIRTPSYWDYLVNGAEHAIECDAPSQANFDSKEKLIPGPSPEFVTWAQSHSLSIDEALDAATLRLPAKVLFLADTADRRPLPLLRKALESPNFVTQTFAATGLADLQDNESIPLLIAACRRAPAEVAYTIAVNSLRSLMTQWRRAQLRSFFPRS